jgi:hypothetical protein
MEFGGEDTGGSWLMISSPRASRMRQVNTVDDDMPPTTSLRDSTDTPTRIIPTQSFQE